MAESLSEKKIIDDIKLLREIRRIWTDFSRLVMVIKRMHDASSHFIQVCRNYPDFRKDESAKGKAAIEKIMREISHYIKLLRKNDLEEFRRCVLDFEELLTDDRYEEFRKTLKEKEALLTNFVGWYKENISIFFQLYTYLKNRTYEDIPRDFFEKSGFYSTQWRHDSDYDTFVMLSFIPEIDAMLRNELMTLKNYGVAKRFCRKKVLNIFSPGLVIHYSREWYPETIVKFVARGIMTPAMINSDSCDSFFRNMVSFYLIPKKGRGYPYPMRGESICFIIDPLFVQKNHRHFYYNPFNKNSAGYEEMCKSMSFNAKTEPDYAQIDEIQSDIKIPFTAIIGAIICEEVDIKHRVMYLMNRLIRKHPELAFPIYDSLGNVIWPL